MMHKILPILIVVLGLFATPCFAQTESEPTIGQLLAGALAKKSASYSYKSGVLYDEISKATRSTDPVLVRFVYVKALDEKECFRIRLVIAQSNVPKRDGSFINFEQIQEFNTCMDGSNPKIGRDEKIIKPF